MSEENNHIAPTKRDAERISMDKERLDNLIKRAQEVIDSDKIEVPPFWVNKYKKEAAKNWDLFYKRNTTKFFKGKSRYKETLFVEKLIVD
jgi:methyltransferase-like protein 6